MEIQGLKRFPEWKALYDGMLPLLEGGKDLFSYEELGALAGIDVREGRGRQQFYQCRKELLRTKQLWLEVVSKSGYAVIAAKDHPAAAYRRVTAARRRVNMAKAINTNVRIEEMTPDQRLVQAATSAVLSHLSKTFHSVGHRFGLAALDASKIPVDIEKLNKSIEAPKRKPKGTP